MERFSHRAESFQTTDVCFLTERILFCLESYSYSSRKLSGLWRQICATELYTFIGCVFPCSISDKQIFSVELTEIKLTEQYVV